MQIGERAAPLTFGRIVIMGGGCYGSWYAQQLTRAVQRGALQATEVVVVDRDPECRVVGLHRASSYEGLPLTVAVSDWDSYVAQWLGQGPGALVHDAMVPSPLMPHVCLDWLIGRARARWPERSIRVAPLEQAPATPWERASPDGRHYVSFATWMCPVNCIEPARCPHTRSARDWSMPPMMRRYVEDNPTLLGPVIFHCVHRTYGVGMIDAAAIADADRQLAAWGASGPCAVLVGTVSHCHGALGVLAID
jgi:hypothetical protein